MDKVELTEKEQRELDIFLEEFKARGGMDDDELISRLGAIPFEEFMNELSVKIRNYKKKMVYERKNTRAHEESEQ